MIEVNRYVLKRSRILSQDKPLHDVALDRLRQIVDGICAICEAKVDDRGRVRSVACGTPK